MKYISEKAPEITFKNELFVNHEEKTRSGHLGHAMVECKNGDILAFYSNCSGEHPGYPHGGHTMKGWVEYKRSKDRGITWGKPEILKYSYDCFEEGRHFIGCEKAVVCDDGSIVLFCLKNMGDSFEPYDVPTYLISRDNGHTWSEAQNFMNERGRIYDAAYKNGKIYVLEFCHSTEKGFICEEENVFYKMFISNDNGKSFNLLSEIPFNTLGHAYGNFIIREDNSIVFYAYNQKDEYNLTCLISNDMGKSWGEPFKSRVDKIARNPQVGYLNGYYVLHARSEKGVNFVFYYSKDAVNWSEGTIVSELLEGKPRGGCYYSNNLNIKGNDGVERMLVQYSEQYMHESARVNIMHAWISIE